MSLHIFAFQNIPSKFYFLSTKTYIFLAEKGPPPLSDTSAKNVHFLDGSSQFQRIFTENLPSDQLMLRFFNGGSKLKKNILGENPDDSYF